MHAQPSLVRRLGVCLTALAVFGFLAPVTSGQSQPASIPSRIVQPIDESNRVVLTGNTYYLARPKNDLGAAPDSLPMQRMLMVLRRGPDQEAALDQFLQDQQNSASPSFHHWLTPQQFGAQFGPSPRDIQAITVWLESSGFTVNSVSNGATVIEFSGTAGQVRAAFGTAIHNYSVNGVDHWANSSDPSIPAALAPVVVGFDTLHNFPRTAMHIKPRVITKTPTAAIASPGSPSPPLYTLSCGNGSGTSVPCYGLGPYDFGTIYNVLPLWNSTPAIDGTGQSIAIIGESDVDKKDIESFQALFGLPTKDPNVIIDGPDPGMVPGDETESDLDLEWSGSVAKGAAIDFVIAATTNTTLGVDIAALDAVDQNVAPVLSLSYGICEAGLGTAGNQYFNSLWQQAAAEGISVFVSAGDNGSAGCDNHDAPAPNPAEFGLQVSGFASTPYNVAVGGTDFNYHSPATAAPFWNTTNASPTQESAKSYIPEVPWNDTCTSPVLELFGYSTSALANCNNSQLLKINVFTVGGSGGKSSCTTGDGMDVTSCSGGYAKPTWQSGEGVPSDGKRDIPDVSLYASAGFYTGTFYIICEADQTGGTYCSSDNQEFLGTGGTSASSPSFAGIMAMVDQKTNSREGNPNYVLYNLSAPSGASCTSSASPGGSCVFYDITTGTNAMPCDDTVAQPVNCGTAGPEGIGILTGYNSNAGYDLVTGLGSVNAANLVNKWSAFAVDLKPSATTLSISPTTNIVHGTPVTVNIGVSPVAPATGTPTGTVSLLSTSSIDPGVTSFALSSGSFSGTTGLLPGGSYTVTANYPGDNTFSGSASSPAVPITVTPEGSKTSVSVITVNQQGQGIPFTSGAYGSAPLFPRADVVGNSGNGFPSGSVTLLDNGQPINGGLTLPLNSQGNALPTNPIYTFPAGSHSITASYTGDASFTSSSSTTPATFTITLAPVSVSVTANATIRLGSSTTIFASISATSCGNPPTGTVTFFNGSTQLGAPQPIPATISSSNCTVQSPNLSVTSSSFSQGGNTITARYSGDTNYASSVSPPVTIDDQASTTTTVSASPTTIQQGQTLTLTAAVTPNQTGGPSPTGTVSFSTSAFGVSLPSATLTNGQAQITTTALPTGTNSVVAVYAGDANNALSSGNVVVTVNPGPNFSLTFNPSTINVSSPGASASTTVTVTGSNGFNSTVNFANAVCAGLPSESSCSFNPTSVSPGGTTTLTISTTAPSLLAPSRHPLSPMPSYPIRQIIFRAASWQRLLLLLAGLSIVVFQFRRRQWRWLAPALLFSLLVINSGCGGGSSGPTNPGTPKVQGLTVTVQVTSGSIVHNFSFILNVN